ncbi:hypothetical protein MIMGU_mgv1a026194mg, partial [Erythranthe guttata]
MEELNRETAKLHFRHPHPLKLIVYNQTLNLNSPCSACKLKPSAGMLYSCIIFPHYFLHKSCFETQLSRWSIPTPSRVDSSEQNNEMAVEVVQQMIINNSKAIAQAKLTHPIDKRHALTLLAEPAYGEGQFRCDACRESGNGYSYHCRICGIDLHVSCAMLPLSVTRVSHVHTLHLFPCDICMKPGSRQWLYRCKPCGFNAHLKCGAPGMMNGGFPGGVPTQITNTNNGANTDVAQGLIGLVSGNGTMKDCGNDLFDLDD